MQFTDKLNKLVSGLLWLVQIININADAILNFLISNEHAVPGKYKVLVGLVIGGLQFWIAQKAHKVNPDGSTALVAYRPDARH